MEFTGYYAGWDRCAGCGQHLELRGKTLVHKKGGKAKHDLVVQKKKERYEQEQRRRVNG